jgi:hypothetical protein
MNTKLLLCTIGCVVSHFFANAQSRKTARDSSTVIIFNQHSTASGYIHRRAGEDNIIKIAPLGFITGAFPLAYERKITDFLSVQVGGGLTYKNYVRGVFKKEGESDNIHVQYPWGGDNYSDMGGSIYNYDFRKAKMGYLYSIQPRFYYESEALDGFFIGLSYDFYRYNFESKGLTATSGGGYEHLGSMKSEHENITDYMVHFGQQVVNDRLTLEYSTGIGIRKVKGEKYAATTTSGGSILEGNAVYSESIINFGISFKLGYHF